MQFTHPTKSLLQRSLRPLYSPVTCRTINQVLCRASFSVNATPPSEKTTHFGYKTVPEDLKEDLVGQVFGSVAKNYDTMNDFMSMGIHRLWKDHYINKLSPTRDTKLLDVAGGTGDIAFRFLNYVKRLYGPMHDASVMVVDINPAMLEVGKVRAVGMLQSDEDMAKIQFKEGNAENLVDIESESADAYTIAFGIRNCTHIDKVLKEAYRVLKPGGRFMCLEFGKVDNPVISRIYETYSFEVIPKIGHVVANDKDSYQYLVESIRKFPSQPEFAQMIRDAGFTVVGKGWEDLTFGVAAIHSAILPLPFFYYILASIPSVNIRTLFPSFAEVAIGSKKADEHEAENAATADNKATESLIRRVSKIMGIFGVKISRPDEAVTLESFQHDDVGRMLVNAVGAYAIVKVLLPVRIAVSMAATPWFARSIILPIRNLFVRKSK
ncbi:2-hexaprenyl-6-methoxy-1,4-benzoquinone methyltransferase [Nowakowskiella sp. JEL0407]|nr:2-hexaprenyl-6-methoxy-1,4-benzoquinone methyltransferase [Nowakowskiella sp. JEL0407]